MIKSTFSVTLVLAMVVAVVIPLEAQEPRSGESGDSQWSRVRRIAPGTQITVTNRDSQAATLYFVSADDAGLTGLYLTDPALPVAAARALRDIASRHPEYIDGATKGRTFLVNSVRLAPAGVFVADRKVADLQHLVTTSVRQEIAGINARKKGRGIWGHLGPLGGYFVGAIAGGYVAGFACQAAVGRDRCDTGPFLAGMLVGGITGGTHGFRAANRETEAVIYRAP